MNPRPQGLTARGSGQLFARGHFSEHPERSHSSWSEACRTWLGQELQWRSDKDTDIQQGSAALWVGSKVQSHDPLSMAWKAEKTAVLLLLWQQSHAGSCTHRVPPWTCAEGIKVLWLAGGQVPTRGGEQRGLVTTVTVIWNTHKRQGARGTFIWHRGNEGRLVGTGNFRLIIRNG